MNFQEMIMALNEYWGKNGCIVIQPYDTEKGAATMNPATSMRALGPEPWKAAYIEPCRRPTDGRYGENPNRLQHYYQYQVILKPSPENIQELYLGSLVAIGIDPLEHDIRFVEDNWESPTMGAWGLGWEVWLDGMEISQFTYFQQFGGMDCRPVCGEITYGLERIATYIQKVDSVYDITVVGDVKYGDIYHQNEVDYSHYNFVTADTDMLFKLFDMYEAECKRVLEAELPQPAFDYCLKCSHSFNLLDARSAISVTERQSYILRVRNLARACTKAYLEERERLGFPMLKEKAEEAAPAKAAAAPVQADAPRDLLWEIGTEEIPARFLPDLIDQITKLSANAFADNGLAYESLRVMATPRRLTLTVKGLSPKAADVAAEAKGPAVKAAYDGDGNPTKALLGFCRGQGVDPKDVQQKEINGNLYIYINKVIAGKTAGELLPVLLPEIAGKIFFAKPMRWGENQARFVRPIHWIVALYGSDVISFEYAGVESGRITRGHRFLGSSEILLNDASEYVGKLEENYVIVDQDMRRSMIEQQIAEAAAKAGGKAEDDADLLKEVVYLLEYPTALVGTFEEKYLELPQELVLAPMKDQQRYFPMYDAEGKLMNRFITVRNGDANHLEVVTDGNEKVLKARLSDAEFFWQEDLKANMADQVERLATVVFHEKLGTLRQKVERIMALTRFIGEKLGYSEAEIERAVRSAYLAKADLQSRVVFEFPELQGIIGEYYANAAGEDKEVAQAIREHYLPRFAGDALPETKAGVAAALADKIDSIAAFFAIGQIPSGSADPFALRRAASGCTQIILKHELALPLRELFPFAFELLQKDVPNLDLEKAPERLESMVTFLTQRLENQMAEENISYDIVNSVRKNALLGADLLDVARKARALSVLKGSDRFHALLAGYHRAANILRSAREKEDFAPVAVEESLFAVSVEQDLYLAVQKAEGEVAQLAAAGDYKAALEAMSLLAGPIDAFFEKVMVMDPDEKIRRNRVAMLDRIVVMSDAIADLREIVE